MKHQRTTSRKTMNRALRLVRNPRAAATALTALTCAIALTLTATSSNAEPLPDTSIANSSSSDTAAPHQIDTADSTANITVPSAGQQTSTPITSAGSTADHTNTTDKTAIKAVPQTQDQPAFTTDTTSGPDQGGTRIALTPHDPAPVRFTQLSAGYYHSLALTDSGRIYTWGYNNVGQLGDGTVINKTTPTPITIPGNPTITQISAGQYHNLALDSNGHLWAWGWNIYGQIGNNTKTNQTKPTDITPAGVTFTQAKAGGYNSIALTSNGRIYTWGYNNRYQLGNGTTTFTIQTVPQPIAVPDLQTGETITTVSTGEYSVFALTSIGRVYAWGWNLYGQLGNGTKTDSPTPKPVSLPAGIRIATLANGRNHTLALTDDGKLYTWGYNNQSQLGNNAKIDRTTPVLITIPDLSSGERIDMLSAGEANSLIHTNQNRVFTWGWNNVGQLGNGTTTNSLTPKPIPNLTTRSAIACGYNHTLTLTDSSNGNLIAWGYNNQSQLGNGTNTNQTKPTTLNSITPSMTVTSVIFDTMPGVNLGLHQADGHWIVYTPAHPAGQVTMTINRTLDGQPQTPITTPYTYTFTPTYTVTFDTKGGSTPPADQHILQGKTPTWPSTNPTKPGSLFNGWTLDGTTPYDFDQPVTRDTTITAMWGEFTATPLRGPKEGGTQVNITPPENSKFLTLSSGGYFTLVRSATGDAYGWGLDHYGQLGNGTINNNGYNLPQTTMQPSGVKYTDIIAGGCSANAIGNDGNTYAFGNNMQGVAGIGDYEHINLTVPQRVQIPQGITLSHIAKSKTTMCVQEFALAVGSDGNTYSWGSNTDNTWDEDEPYDREPLPGNGTLGNGTTDNSSVPVKVILPAGVRFVQLAAGGNFALGLGDDGLIYAWGNNSLGQLGINNPAIAESAAPVRVLTPAGKTFTSISAAYSSAYAIASDGTAWAWGNNTDIYNGSNILGDGVLGDGTTTNRMVPVQITPAGVKFSQIRAGQENVIALSDNGTVYSWGSNNSHGIQGNGTTRANSTPTPINNSLGQPFVAVQIGISDVSSYFTTTDGTMWACGYNEEGQLGNGTNLDSSTPVRVNMPLVNVTQVKFGTGTGAKPGTRLAWDYHNAVWTVISPAYQPGETDMTITWTLSNTAQTPAVLRYTYTTAIPALSALPFTGSDITALSITVLSSTIAAVFLGIAIWLRHRQLTAL